MPWHAIGINKMQEFMLRYEEIAIDAQTELRPVPTTLTIYLEYYKKNIGWGFRRLELFLKHTLKPYWGQYDKEFKYWPHGLMKYCHDNFWEPHPKTAGVRIVNQVLLPTLIVLVTLVGLCCRCCCGKKRDSKVKEE